MLTKIGILWVVLALPILSGCAINAENTSVMPGVDLSRYESYFVVEEDDDDEREVGKAISGQLAAMGYISLIGRVSEVPSSTEVIVRYGAKWGWDMRSYLWTLNIRFQDASSLLPLATATSEHGSANKKSKSYMVEEVLVNLFAGKSDVFENAYFDAVLAPDMLVSPENQIGSSLPLNAQVIGFGTQLASDEAFNEALTSSVVQYGIFESVSDDGEYILAVALNSLITDDTNLPWLYGTIIFHNVSATASWALTDKDRNAILYRSEIVTVCPDNKLKDNKGVTKMTACAIRENLRSGFGELRALDLK